MASETTGLRELGERLRARREESRLSIAELSRLSRVPAHEIDSFEGGHGGVGAAALIRIAGALGVPPASFVHTRAPKVRALVEPSVLLRASRAAWLRDDDRDVLADALRRARAFNEIGELLRVERLADGFRPTPPPADRPFLDGARVALEVRARIPERTGTLRDLVRLLENRFNTLVVRHRFADGRLLGAACRSGDARVIAVNTASSTETTRRFTLAHELGHHVLYLDESGAIGDELDEGENRGRFWFDTPPHEKRANAFAAMLLAPTAFVESIIGPRRRVSSYEEAKRLVETVRGRAGMGFAATAWHLHNVAYLEESLVRELLIAEPDADPLTGFEDEPRFDGLVRRVFEALSRGIITRGRARELLGEDLERYDPGP
jgi:transcriptional regulator with XRE-family HTH domain